MINIKARELRRHIETLLRALDQHGCDGGALDLCSKCAGAWRAARELRTLVTPE